jgi:hypothetical protein
LQSGSLDKTADEPDPTSESKRNSPESVAFLKRMLADNFDRPRNVNTFNTTSLEVPITETVVMMDDIEQAI